jgi:integrase/recombinase XerD
MNTPERFAELVQTFFCDYLIKQRDLSPRTVSAYRDTFRLLLSFLQRACGKRPDQLMLSNLTAAQLLAFLQYLEEERGNCVRTRNLRLAAPRSFFRYVGACKGPENDRPNPADHGHSPLNQINLYSPIASESP